MSQSTRPSLTPCPDPETLAAFIDGRLGEEERSRTARHLADCEDCGEVLAETLHFQQEEAEAAETAEIAAFPSPASHRQLLPLAALLAVALAAGLLWSAWSRPDFGSGVMLVAAVEDLDYSPDKQTTEVWGIHRGNGDSAPPSPGSKAALRLGVYAVDLTLFLQSGETQTARDWLRRMQELEKNSDIFLLPPRYTELVERLQENPELDGSTLLQEVLAAERAVEESLEDTALEAVFDLGRWAEAARHAALAGNDAFLAEKRRPRSISRRLGKEPGYQEIRQEFEALLASDLGPDPADALKDFLKEIEDIL